MATEQAEHALRLAAELLEDVELSRCSVSTAVLKATRLARLVEDDEAEAWLRMELHGYTNDRLGHEYMSLTGRWKNKDENNGYWIGISAIEAYIDAMETLLGSMRLPDVSGEYASIALRETRKEQSAAARAIGEFAAIRGSVLALIHRFASTRYYELLFSAKQAELFERARAQVDALLSPLSGETLSKIESIYRRLGECDREAVSHALLTCRRLIDAVADAIYAPTTETIDLGEKPVQLTHKHVQNRLNVYVAEHTSSESRRKKLRRSLSDLYDRVSTGVHAEVSASEARFLFLHTYLYLGEVLSLGNAEY